MNPGIISKLSSMYFSTRLSTVSLMVQDFSMTLPPFSDFSPYLTLTFLNFSRICSTLFPTFSDSSLYLSLTFSNFFKLISLLTDFSETYFAQDLYTSQTSSNIVLYSLNCVSMHVEDKSISWKNSLKCINTLALQMIYKGHFKDGHQSTAFLWVYEF